MVMGQDNETYPFRCLSLSCGEFHRNGHHDLRDARVESELCGGFEFL